jgi:hypothetical protein
MTLDKIIELANTVNEPSWLIEDDHFRRLARAVGDFDTPEGEYLVDELDAVKDSKIVPLHILVHIRDLVGNL